MKRMGERIKESVLRWFGPIERIGNVMISNRVYVEKCVGSCLVGRLRKRWTENGEVWMLGKEGK